MTRPRRLAALLTLLAAVATGCGSDDGGDGAGAATGDGEQVVVSAAASLKTALTAYGDAYDRGPVRFSFAGSDELAGQIRQGVKPDVYAAANTKLPDQLFAEGLVERPQVFATNRLVLAVPADEDRIRAIGDLITGDVTIAAGASGVPIGDYTDTVLGRLPAAQAKAVRDRVRSREPDVGGIVGKLTQGAVDAGFVYASDVRAAGGRLRAVELPAALQPEVAYGVAVVRGAPNPDGARAFVAGLLRGRGAGALRAAGFGAPPAAP